MVLFSLFASNNKVYRRRHRAVSGRSTFHTRDALVIANHRQLTDFNVHWTGFIASLAIDAGFRVASQRSDAEEVENALECAIGTSIFAPGTFNKQRGDDG